MIAFACPHCGNVFRVGDEHAGRYGFCRFCRALVEVPTSEGGKRLDDLSPEERVPRLVTLLREAETRYERKRTQLKQLYDKSKILHEQALQAGSLQKSLTKAKARLTEAERQTRQLGKDLPDIAMARGKAEAQNELMTAELERLSTELDIERERRKDLEDALRDQQERSEHVEQVEEELHAARAKQIENESLVERLREDLVGLNDDPGYAQERLSRLATELAQLKAQLDVEQAARGKMEAALVRSQAELDRVEQDLVREREAAATSQADVTRLRAAEGELAVVTARLEESQSAMAILHPELSKTVRALGDAEAQVEARAREVDSMQAQLDIAHANLKEFEARGHEAEDRLLAMSRLEEQVLALEVANAELKERLAGADVARDELRDLKDSVQTSRLVQDELQTLLKDAVAQMQVASDSQAMAPSVSDIEARLRAENEALLLRVAEVTELERSLESERQKRDDAEAQSERLQSELALVAADGPDDVAGHNAQAALEMDRLETELAAAREAQHAGERSLQDHLTKAARIEGQVALLQEELERTRAELAAVRSEVVDGRTLAAKLEETEAVLERMTAELQAASQAIGSAEARASHSEKTLKSLSDELAGERKAKHEAELAQKAAEVRASMVERQDRPAETAPAVPAPPGQMDASTDGLSLIPELVDGGKGDDQDALVDTLLRFIDSQK